MNRLAIFVLVLSVAAVLAEPAKHRGGGFKSVGFGGHHGVSHGGGFGGGFGGHRVSSLGAENISEGDTANIIEARGRPRGSEATVNSVVDTVNSVVDSVVDTMVDVDS